MATPNRRDDPEFHRYIQQILDLPPSSPAKPATKKPSPKRKSPPTIRELMKAVDPTISTPTDVFKSPGQLAKILEEGRRRVIAKREREIKQRAEAELAVLMSGLNDLYNRKTKAEANALKKHKKK